MLSNRIAIAVILLFTLLCGTTSAALDMLTERWQHDHPGRYEVFLQRLDREMRMF